MDPPCLPFELYMKHIAGIHLLRQQMRLGKGVQSPVVDCFNLSMSLWSDLGIDRGREHAEAGKTGPANLCPRGVYV